MSITPEELTLHLQLGEDSSWEFKGVNFKGDAVVAPLQKDLADEMAAFANRGGGVLVCGVDDDGHTTPLTRTHLDALEQLLFQACVDSIEPELSVEIHRMLTTNGAAVLVAEIPKGMSAHRSPGGTFHRIGSSKRLMSEPTFLRLAQERNQSRFLWFDKQAVPQTGINVLEPRLYQRLLSTYVARDPETGLMQLGLLSEDHLGVIRATVAGVLFCTSNPEQWLPQARIRATRYSGTDQSTRQLDHQDITGPIDLQIRFAVDFVLRHMWVSARKQPGRVELPQFSEVAIFEAIVNAVAHRDYAIRESVIRLAMFDDRLELRSPGALPNTVTVESMRVRQATRNEVLTSILGRLRIENIHGGRQREFFLERRGDGVPIIYRETELICGRAPRYEVIDGAELCLVLPAARDDDSANTVTIAVWSSGLGLPMPNVEILALYPDRTWESAATDLQGEARFFLRSTHLPMTVLAAAPGCAAHVVRNWIPTQHGLGFGLVPMEVGGSVIFRGAAGQLPSLQGRLNPELDAQDRAFLYAANILINEGMSQPVYFQFGETLRLEDQKGSRLDVRILAIAGQACLLEYAKVN